MSRDIPPFPVRLPIDLREKLEILAVESGRSLNSEIVARLEQSVSEKSVQDTLDRIHRDVSKILYSVAPKKKPAE